MLFIGTKEKPLDFKSRKYDSSADRIAILAYTASRFAVCLYSYHFVEREEDEREKKKQHLRGRLENTVNGFKLIRVY